MRIGYPIFYVLCINPAQGADYFVAGLQLRTSLLICVKFERGKARSRPERKTVGQGEFQE